MGAMTDDTDDLEPIDLAAAPPTARWPEGWYADPWTAGQYRYWNGQSWTGATHRWGPANLPPAGTGAWPAATSGVARGYAVPETAVAAVEPMGPRRSRGVVVAAVIALIAVLVASGAIGYAINANSQDHSAVQVTPGPNPSTPNTPQVPASKDPDAKVLSRVVVRQGDVASARKVVLYAKGDTLEEPTLDLCNGRFASEAERSARLQVVDVDASGAASLSTEAVLYRSPDAATQAFAELRKVRAGVSGQAGGEPDRRYEGDHPLPGSARCRLAGDAGCRAAGLPHDDHGEREDQLARHRVPAPRPRIPRAVLPRARRASCRPSTGARRSPRSPVSSSSAWPGCPHRW